MSFTPKPITLFPMGEIHDTLKAASLPLKEGLRLFAAMLAPRK